MKLINYEEFKRLLLEERDKIPLTVPCATYELRKEKPYYQGQYTKHGIRLALRCLERCQDISTDISTIEQPKWISCAERLPETWQRVLAYREGYGILSDVILSGGEWCGDMDTKKAVTYWMPLPMPPKGDE